LIVAILGDRRQVLVADDLSHADDAELDGIAGHGNSKE